MNNKDNIFLKRDFESEIFSQTPWALKLLPTLKKPLALNDKLSKKSLTNEETVLTIKNSTKKETPLEKENGIGEIRKKLLHSTKTTSQNEKSSSEEEIVLNFHKLRKGDLSSYLRGCEEKYSVDVKIFDGDFHDGSQVDVMFVGEKMLGSSFPIILSASCSDKDLAGRMITAMKIGHGKFIRRFIPSDASWETSKSVDNPILEDLANEILFFKPKVVISMGAGVTNMLLGRKERLSKIHGQSFPLKISFSESGDFSFKMIPIFHPDFLKINPSMKRTAWIDLQEVMKLL